MKKVWLVLVVGFLLLGMVACNKQAVESEPADKEEDRLQMEVALEEVTETEFLGRAINSDQFDLMRINIEGISLDFTPMPGQMVKVAIKNQDGRSQQPYTIATEMTLLEP